MQTSEHEVWEQELGKHQITDVKYYLCKARYPRLHGKNAIKGYHGYGGEILVARLTADSGISGWGQITGTVEQAKQVRDLLTGQPVSHIFSADSGILDSRLKPFDIPLHDLAGMILQIPVCRMIASDAVLHAPLYDGAIYMNDIIPENKPFGTERVIQEAVDDTEKGHTRLKVKIGRGHQWMTHDEGLQRDIDIVKGIHEALPWAEIMVDANDGYSLEDAENFLERIGDTRICWFEEPFRENEEDNSGLKAYLQKYRPGTLIADGESMTDIPLLTRLSEKRLLDVWQPDILSYGFTNWRTLMKSLSARGWLASPHTWGDITKTYYTAHLAAAYPHHIPCVEAVPGTIEGIDMSGYSLEKGILSLPDRPGFGMDFIWNIEI